MSIQEQLIKELGQLTVLDNQQKSIVLASLWKNQKTVLIFVRHFGWLICRRQVADIQENLDTFNNINVRVVVIGNGQPNFIDGFRNDTGYKGDLFTDPSLKTYELLNFKKSVGSLLGVKTFKSALDALKSGYLQKGIQGNAFQQGGVVVIHPVDKPVYFYISEKAGDHAPLDEIINACK